MKKKVFDYVCSHCRSNYVLCDAYAEWDVVEQKWELQNTLDKSAYCNKCDGETRLERIELAMIPPSDEDDDPNYDDQGNLRAGSDHKHGE